MNLLRPEIRDLEEYHLAQHPHRIKLNQNENPYELPAEVKQEVLDRLAGASWSRYPAFVPEEHIALVASFAGWKPAGTLLGNGSNDLLQLIFMAVLERGRTVVLSQPTFTLYKLLARGLGADVCEVAMTRDLRFDVGAIIEAARRTSAALIVLCSPNNPTGSCLTADEVRSVVESTEGLVVLDEAYVHFASGSLHALLNETDRVIILQTFSKAMGAAGLRFGYALAPVAIARELNKIKLPYSVNIFTLIGAEVFIRKWDIIRWWIGRITEERERVRAGLAAMTGVRVYPSEANFLLVEFLACPAREVFLALARKGILVRDVTSYPMLNRCLRITVGTPEENTAVLTALQEDA